MILLICFFTFSFIIQECTAAKESVDDIGNLSKELESISKHAQMSVTQATSDVSSDVSATSEALIKKSKKASIFGEVNPNLNIEQFKRELGIAAKNMSSLREYTKKQIDNFLKQAKALNLDDDHQKSAIANFKSKIKQYWRAVTDSATQSVEKQRHDLVSIVPWNDNLIWSENKTHILVISWIPAWLKDKWPEGWKRFTDFEAKTATHKFNDTFEVWVSVVPELKNKLEIFTPSAEYSYSDRVREILGLIPNIDYIDERIIVEIWIDPSDLFRPCLNSDVMSNSCLLDMPKETLPDKFHDKFKFVAATKAHKEFYLSKKHSTYTTDQPFPWTRLGYTYDWGKSADKQHYGVSEFILKNCLKKPCAVFIRKIYTPEEYAKSKTIESESVKVGEPVGLTD
ncbi:MAG: hypothetical protein V1646_02510 [bacterium]